MAKTLIEIRAETSQYQQAMRQAAAEMKNLTAQHSLAAAQAKLSGSAQDALRARVTELTSKIDVQKGIVQQNGQQYDNLKQKLELQKTAHDQLKTKVEAAKKAYEDSAKATGEDSEETQKLKAEYEKLSSQLSTSESQITKTETAITKQEAAVNQSKAALTEMEAELKNVNAELAHAPFDEYAAKAEKVGGTLTSVGQKLLPLSTGIAGLGVAAVKTTADFDSEMSKVSAISGATGTDLDKLRGKAREMGAKTKFSASEAAQGMQYMAMAGWKTQDMMDGLEGIMNLAAASGEDLASTSDIVTDALTAFGLSAKDSSHFSDILAAASSNANTNVSMMGETFKYAAPVLGSLGYTAEDAALAIGLMANAGIKSSQAGTSLRGAITNLAKPTDTVAAAMDKYGISLTDSSGKMLSLRELMEQMRQKLGGLSEAEQAQAAAALFGKEAMSGMLAIINGSDKDFEKLAGAIDNCDGSSEKMANTMNDNLQGQITILMSQLQELAISFGEILMPKIRDIVTHIQNFVDKLNAMDEGQKETILRIGMFVAALAPMLMGLGKVITFSANVSRALGTLSARLVKAGGFSGVFTKALGLITSPAAIVVGVIAAITAVIIHLWNTNEDFRNTITAIWQKIKDAFTTFAAGISERLSALGITFSDVTSAIKTIWDGFCNLLVLVLEAAFSTIAIALQTAFNVILGIWDVFSAVFSGDWSGAWEAVKGIFSSIWDGLKEYFSTIIGAVKGVADVFLGWFGTNWETVWNGVKTFFEGIWNGISSFFEGIWNGISTFCTTVWNGIVTNVTAFCTTVHDTISTIFNAVKDVVSNVWETIKNVVQVAIMFIVEVIKAAFELITVPFRFIWENCRDTIISVWETIKSAVQTAINFVKDNIITPVMNAISTTISTVWNAIQTTFTTVINAIKSAVQTAWNFMKDNVITPVMNAISTTISTVWNTIKTTFTTVINAIKSAVQTAWNFMKNSVITPVMNGIKTVITTVWNAIKTAVQTVVNAIKTTVQTVFNAVKTTVTTIWNAIKTGTSTAWNAVKTAVTTPINAAKSAVTSAINGIKSTISSVWNSVKSATSSTWNAIKRAITTPINAAKTAVGNAISAIRSKFNFSWSLPHLRLPHPSISGSFSLNPPSVPHFSISWYKNGGIMTKPTAFGAAGDTLLAGGEAGAEAILPLKQFYDRLGDMLDKKLDAIMTGTTVYVYVTMDGEVVATKVYSKVEEKFTDEIKRRR
jgi:TP901 family phage tail tape measure protein